VRGLRILLELARAYFRGYIFLMKREPERAQVSAWEEAQRLGCDMSLIEANLELSYTERCIQHDRAITAAMALREAALQQIHGLSDAIKKVS